MSDDTDTHPIRPHDDKRHEAMSNRDFMREIDMLREELRKRKDERHESNTKVHQLFGEVSMRLDQHDDEIKALRDQGAEQLAVLRDIKTTLIGAYGSDGITARLKNLEAESEARDDQIKARLAAIEPVVNFGKWLGVIVGGVIVTALTGALIWALVQSKGGAP
jgi:hypothetical protein